MAAKKKKSPEALEAKKHLANDEPYAAWTIATKATEAGGDATELLKIVVDALSAIVSDLDEHGEDNLYLYGDGKHTEEEFKELLTCAKTELRDLVEPDRPRSTFAPLPKGPAKLAFGAPRAIAKAGPPPVVIGEFFLGRDGEKLALRDSSGKVARTLDADGEPKCAAASPDGSSLAVGYWGGRVVVLDVPTGKVRWETEKQKDWVFSIGFSLDGAMVVSGGEGRIMLHDTHSGKALATKTNGDARYHAVAFVNADTIAVICDDHVRTHSVPDLEVRTKNKTDLGAHLLVNASGRALMVPYNAIALLDPQSADVLASAKIHEKKTRWCSAGRLTLGPKGDVAALVFTVAPSASKSINALQLWRLDPLERIAAVPLPKFKEAENLGTGGIGFLPNGLVVGGEAATLFVPYA